MSKVKSVLVTAANRGIGLELLKSIRSKLKPEVIFATFRDPAKSKELHDLAAANQDIKLIQLDVKDYGKFDEVAKQVAAAAPGGLNLLINNAGVASEFIKFNQLALNDVQNNLDTNLVAPLLLTKALLPEIEKASAGQKAAPAGVGRAAIINLTGVLASIGGNNMGGYYPYRVSKAGLNAATKAMSVDFKRNKILAVALHPGWVRTDMGGPKAPILPEQSAEGIVNLLEQLNESHNGQFLQFDGKQWKPLPW